ncbi:MAG: hypothetical protein U0U25_13415 [Flavobacteriales bacterium]
MRLLVNGNQIGKPGARGPHRQRHRTTGKDRTWMERRTALPTP